jgi:RNA polymerase sigma-B factor
MNERAGTSKGCVCTCGSGRDAAAGERAETPDDYRRLCETGDPALRDMLLEAHRWIVVHCARRFADRGEPLDDLMQVGQIGLLKALERFDPEFGSSFATFAVPTVLGEIRRHFRDATWAVRVPRRLKDLHVELAPAKEHLTSLLGRTPSADELADFLRVGVEDVLEALEAGGGYRTSPLTMPGRDAEEPERDAPALEIVDTDLLGTDDRVYVERLLATLPERERQIVTLRFFGELSQSEIAEIVGLSQVHVSRLLRACLTALQAAAGERELVFATS